MTAFEFIEFECLLCDVADEFGTRNEFSRSQDTFIESVNPTNQTENVQRVTISTKNGHKLHFQIHVACNDALQMYD
jgi:hypothetical protein